MVSAFSSLLIRSSLVRASFQSRLLATNKFKVLVFGSKEYDVRHFQKALDRSGIKEKVEFAFEKEDLKPTTVSAAKSHDGICIFVNDDARSAEVVRQLKSLGVKLILLRCAGFNNVDIPKVVESGIKIARVPAYSPYCVAEFSVGCLLALQRNICLAKNRVAIHNFSLEGLEGFELHGKTVGIVGAGKIGQCTAAIYKGFGCKVLAYDVFKNEEVAKKIGFVYEDDLGKLYSQCDVISIHAPLTKDNHHMINEEAIEKMKKGAYLINVGRGALVDSKALLKGLKSGKLGGACLDVYEHEAGVFYSDHSKEVPKDDTLSLLIGCPNVLVTSHQAYLTTEALTNISDTTIANLNEFLNGQKLTNEVLP